MVETAVRFVIIAHTGIQIKGKTLITYAQNYEDVLLNRCFKTKDQGFYIDVGAMDPVDDSVTKHFYDKGWSGINIEPDEEFYHKLCKARTRDINLPFAVGEKNETKTFYLCETPGHSTFCKDFMEHFSELGQRYQSKELEIKIFSEVCEKYVINTTINFMKIDVEGFEDQVIKGANWSRFRPRVLLIESFEPGTENTEWPWQEILIKNDYLPAYFDGLNRYYIRNEDQSLMEHFKYPPIRPLDLYTHYHTKSALDHITMLENRITELDAWAVKAQELIKKQEKVLKRIYGSWIFQCRRPFRAFKKLLKLLLRLR